MVIFLLLLWLGFGVAALHPFVTYPLSLRVLAARWAMPVGGGAAPTRVAVCVCAYNEAGVIAARVENLLAQRAAFPGLDILVYVDAASDDTAGILRGFGDSIRLVVGGARHGKSFGMNTLIGMTDAEIMVFSDANVLFEPGAIAALVAPFGDAAVGCACGHLRYTSPGDASATAVTGSVYWRLEERIKELESATGSVMGADGSIFAIRRALHRAPPVDLIDDMFVSLSVLCAGYRIVRVADAVATEEAVSRPAEEYRRKIRIACQAFNVNRALWPRLMGLPVLDRYKYVSHKLLRWLSVYLLGASTACLLLAVLAVGDMALSGAVMSGAIAAGSALWLASWRPAAKIRDILAALVATGIGVWRSVQGDRFQTWTPPSSARHVAAE